VEGRLGYSRFFSQPIKLTTTINILVLDILLKIEWQYKPRVSVIRTDMRLYEGDDIPT
jgi:hypothetical protein